MPAISVPVIWIAAGLVLMMLEMASPGVFMVWIGLAAVGTGILVQLLEPAFWIQVLVFTLLAGALVALSLRLRGPRKAARINTPDSGLVGRPAIAIHFTGQNGRVRLGDSEWPARLAHGVTPPEPETNLRVVAVDGTTLVVGLP